MLALDFEYDGKHLSDMGYVICRFDNSGGTDIVSNGSEITFNTISTLGGRKQEFVSTRYDNCLETTFQICKDHCIYQDDYVITIEELRELTRWLNRKEYHKFKLLDDSYYNLFFEGSFNISRVEVAGQLVGLELNFKTNRPYALLDERTISRTVDEPNTVIAIGSESDEEGAMYLKAVITVKADGDLSLFNVEDNKSTVIRNCVTDEVITLDYPIITSSIPSHDVANDFNYNFLRLLQTYTNKTNKIRVSLPCVLKLSYNPVVKVGI